MNKPNLAVSVFAVLATIALGVYLVHRPVKAPASLSNEALSQSGDKSYTLSCDAKKALRVTFHLPEDKSVDVALDDGRTLTLQNSAAATGVPSYTSADGNTALALAANSTVSLSENKTITYANCVLGTSAAHVPTVK